MASTVTGSVYIASAQIGNMMRYSWDLWGDAAQSTCLQTNAFSGGEGGGAASNFYISHITGKLLGGRIKSDPENPIEAASDFSMMLGRGDSDINGHIDLLEGQGTNVSAADGPENFFWPGFAAGAGSNIEGLSGTKMNDMFVFDDVIACFGQAMGDSTHVTIELYVEVPWTEDGR